MLCEDDLIILLFLLLAMLIKRGLTNSRRGLSPVIRSAWLSTGQRRAELFQPDGSPAPAPLWGRQADPPAVLCVLPLAGMTG